MQIIRRIFLSYRNSLYILLRYINTQKAGNMFGGLTYEQPLTTGKKVGGYQITRKDAPFSLGWDQTNQLNSYQQRKIQGKQITGKITTHGPQPTRNSQSSQNRQEVPHYNQAQQRMRMKQLYEQLAYENPDIPPEALEKYMLDYQQQRKLALAQQQNQIPQNTPPQNQYQHRRPVRQKQSMKDIIYNGVGVGQSMEQKRAASRRNKSNLVLGDGYNYFNENQRK